MLKNDTKYVYHKNCIKDLPCAFISRPYDGNNGTSEIIITSISEDEEKKLLEDEQIIIERGQFKFNVLLRLTYLLGECDLSPQSETLNTLEKSNWLDKIYVKHFMPSIYDFENHMELSNEFSKLHRWQTYDTNNPRVFIPFLWNTINRPNRVVIFKNYRISKAEIKHDLYLKNRREKRKQEHKSVTEEKYYQRAQKRAFESKMQRVNIKIN